MPFYTFECPECKIEKEILQNMNDDPPTCDNCSKMVPRKIVEMKRIFKPMGKPQFKGSGFYETDYKPKITGPGIYPTPEAAMKAAKGKK